MTPMEMEFLKLFRSCFEECLDRPRPNNSFQCVQETPTTCTFWCVYVPNFNLSITTDLRRTYFKMRIWNTKREYDQAVVVAEGLFGHSEELKWIPDLYIRIWNAHTAPQNQTTLRELIKRIWN